MRALLNYAWAPEIDDGNDEPFWAGEEVSKPYVSSLHQEISSKTEYLTKKHLVLGPWLRWFICSIK